MIQLEIEKWNGYCSLRSWRYCKRTRNKVLTTKRLRREENGERDFEFLAASSLLAASPPKLYFALAIPPATQAMDIVPRVVVSIFNINGSKS